MHSLTTNNFEGNNANSVIYQKVISASSLTFPCIISLIVRVTLESSSWRVGAFSSSMLEDESDVSRGILAAYGATCGRAQGTLHSI